MSDSVGNRKPATKDWDQHDVLAALRRRGWSLRQLGFHHGYSAGALHKAFKQPWPKAERILADAIGIQPMQIWPSRYDSKGRPNRLGKSRIMRPAHVAKSSVSSAGRNLQTTSAG
jgi:Ner family transcriptional regulator